MLICTEISLAITYHVVNGRLDLVNMFPAKLDLKPFIDAWGNAARFQIYAPNGSFNFCGVDVSPSAVNTIQTEDVYTTGGDPLYAADLTEVEYEGVDITPSDYLGNNNEPGVLAFEALEADRQLTLAVFFGDVMVFQFPLPASFSSVRDMYRWYNGRHFSDQSEGRSSMMGEPSNNPFGLENVKTLIFLHGANVSEADAEKWGDTLFKRLWLSGFKANFINVDWRGDIGIDANYHQNASNAFVVASQIANDVKNIPGEKVIMAHSLGNMVVSSIIQDYGLQVTKYLICNSAVPAEAYDTALSPTNVLVHKDWNEYPVKARANEWYKLFENDDGDDRHKLTWSGRFADVVDCAVNFYSTGDHVLELERNNNVWATDGYENWNQMFERYSWHKQELWKGRAGMFFNLGTTDWSGWSIRENILGYNAIQPTNAWLMSDAELKTNTVFKLQPESMNTNSIPQPVLDAHLANGIPARTGSSGVIKWGPPNMNSRMWNLNSTDVSQNGISRPNGWPTRTLGWLLTTTWETEWLHSDMKDVSYFYTHKFFEKLKETGGMQ